MRLAIKHVNGCGCKLNINVLILFEIVCHISIYVFSFGQPLTTCTLSLISIHHHRPYVQTRRLGACGILQTLILQENDVLIFGAPKVYHEMTSNA